MTAIISLAHEDYKRRLRRAAGFSLDPLSDDSRPDPAAGYPEQLPLSALKGCFGEVMAGLAAEEFGALDEDGWQVPAFLFRFHQAAFEYLEVRRQGGSTGSEITGRLGDDCLAFQVDGTGRIRRSLVCEAKCTATHDSGMISEAHVKASQAVSKPADTLLLIEILRDYEDQNSKRWVEALQKFYFSGHDPSYERCDLVCYVYGQAPVRNSSWIPQRQPHASYSGGRRLEAVEIYISDIDGLIPQIYARHG